jgi:FtsP/CotA-like multicopper oxidase with cupredoxin domain
MHTTRPPAAHAAESYIYNFIADAQGTYWWHSHYKTQVCAPSGSGFPRGRATVHGRVAADAACARGCCPADATRAQYVDGLWGGLIIEDPTARTVASEAVVAINEWCAGHGRSGRGDARSDTG